MKIWRTFPPPAYCGFRSGDAPPTDTYGKTVFMGSHVSNLTLLVRLPRQTDVRYYSARQHPLNFLQIRLPSFRHASCNHGRRGRWASAFRADRTGATAAPAPLSCPALYRHESAGGRMNSLELKFYEHASVPDGAAWFICREDDPRLTDALRAVVRLPCSSRRPDPSQTVADALTRGGAVGGGGAVPQTQEGTLMARKRLTPEEVSAVNLVTKGESYSHRHWPPEVVRAVINADLVKAADGRPAEPRRAAIRVKALRARLRAKLMARHGRTGGLIAS